MYFSSLEQSKLFFYVWKVKRVDSSIALGMTVKGSFLEFKQLLPNTMHRDIIKKDAAIIQAHKMDIRGEVGGTSFFIF